MTSTDLLTSVDPSTPEELPAVTRRGCTPGRT
jgi:hypothetical protein